MDCAECVRLVKEYQSLLRMHLTAIDDLTGRRSNTLVNEYQRLRKIAEKTRLDAERVRLEMATHQRSHKWGRS
jgi:hypothetical protein